MLVYTWSYKKKIFLSWIPIWEDLELFDTQEENSGNSETYEWNG